MGRVCLYVRLLGVFFDEENGGSAQQDETGEEGGGGYRGFEGKGKKSKRSGSTHMPMTMLMKACLEAVLGVRREDIMDRERGRRSIVATAMNAG